MDSIDSDWIYNEGLSHQYVIVLPSLGSISLEILMEQGVELTWILVSHGPRVVQLS